jgi:hypothetical protein
MSYTPPQRKTTPSAPAIQEPQVTPAKRVQDSYKQLTQAAVSLNSASDELGKAISVLDAALIKLNLGVSAWVTLSQNDGSKQGQDWWWARQFGYTKVRDKWGVALRSISGDHCYPDGDSEDAWLYNDAPRWMRTEAVEKIPELLEGLLKQVLETTKSVQKKTAQAVEMAAAIDALAGEASAAE